MVRVEPEIHRREIDPPYVEMNYQLPYERSGDLEDRSLRERYAEEIAEGMHRRHGPTRRDLQVTAVVISAGAGWLFPIIVEVRSRDIHMDALEELHAEVTRLARDVIDDEISTYSDADYSEIQIRVQ